MSQLLRLNNTVIWSCCCLWITCNQQDKVNSLSHVSNIINPTVRRTLTLRDSSSTVENLFRTIDEKNNEKQKDSSVRIKSYIKQLEEEFEEKERSSLYGANHQSSGKNDSKSKDNLSGVLERTYGYYDVLHVQPKEDNDKENPVGGKWTRKNSKLPKFFRTRRTFQHLIPTNTTGLGRIRNETIVAEAINVISLDAFFGIVRMNVMLRGDAVLLTDQERKNMPSKLSPLAVRAYFDPPTICLGCNRIISIQIGPKSSVVLDTSYVDDEALRIGKGGTSGTRFVFRRTTDAEAKDCFAFLKLRPISAFRLCQFSASLSLAGLFMILKLQKRWFGYLLTILSSLTTVGLWFSTGGIEQQQNRSPS